MSEAAKPSGPFRAAWWLLLLVPLALPAGWLLGGLPVPAQRAPAPVVSLDRPAADRPEARPAAARRPATAASPVRAPAPAPAEEPRPQGVLSQWTTMEGALAESQRNGKPVLIDFSADWCPPCQALKRYVFEDGARARDVQITVIPVSIVDRRRETGSNPPEIEDLEQRYGVDAFPTLVVFSPASGRTMKTKGFGGPEATVEWIKEAARAVR